MEERLDICSILPEEVFIFYILPCLTIPDIAECKLVSKTWLRLVRKYYSCLRELDLSPWDCMVTEDYLINIIKHAKILRSLRLAKCWRACNTVSVSFLAETCSRLQVVNLSHCGSVSDHAVQELAVKCRELREIDLSSCYKITDCAMWALADHAERLQELYVSSVYGVTDYGISHIGFKLPSLQVLDVSYCFRVSNKGLVGFVQTDNHHLKSLRIKGCSKITDDFIQKLWAAGVQVNNMF